MDNLQKHTHSEYCCKNKSCCFGFPKPPATKTLISQPPLDDNDMIVNAKSVLWTVQNTLTTANIQNKSTQEFLQDINLHVDTYMEALQILLQRTKYHFEMKSTRCVYKCMCNQDILSLWRGNVDLQYVINEIATVKYICSYMTKGEKGMGETLKRVAKECQNDAIRTQMNKIKKEFLGKQVLGAPESAM